MDIKNNFIVSVLIIVGCLSLGINGQSCEASIFDVYSSGWIATEEITVTPSCLGCEYTGTPSGAGNDCGCNPDPVPAGEGQPGTEDGGPCAIIGSDYPTNACYGFSRALWDLTDEIVDSPITGLSTNKQRLYGRSNMNPPGIFDTKLSSTGFYAIKISTDNLDNDSMGFVFGYEPLTVNRENANRLEFVWNGKCCCDYTYSIPITCTAEGTQEACCPTAGADPDAWVYEAIGSPGYPGYSRNLLGRVSGGGWERAVIYNFHVELTPRLLRIYRSVPSRNIDPELVFNYARTPTNRFDLSGNFAWYTASQPDVSLGPLELAGEMGFGTNSCDTHETFVEFGMATDCDNANDVEVQVSWGGGDYITYPLAAFTSIGARFEEEQFLLKFVFALTSGGYSTKDISHVITYPPIALSVVSVATGTQFPVDQGTCTVGTNEYLLPWCNNNVGGLQANPTGGNGLGSKANYGYTWTGVSAVTDVVSTLSPGDYSVTVDDAYECTITSETITLSRVARPTVSLVRSCGASILAELSECYNGATYEYSWSTGDNTASISNLQPGTYFVDIGDSSLACTGSLGLSRESITIPDLNFQDVNRNEFEQSGFACESSDTPIAIQFEDWLACDSSDFSGTFDFGDGSTSVTIDSSHFTFSAASRIGIFSINHSYSDIGDYTASLSLVSSKYATSSFDLDFEVIIAPLSEITFPPTLISPGYEMLVYVPYIWEWDRGNLLSGDEGTAVLWTSATEQIILDNKVSLDEQEWTWTMHGLVPGEYPIEIRRNSDGCLIGERKLIELELHHLQD